MSLFRLKTSEAELSSSNNGQSRMDWVQIPPARDVTDFNFSNGPIYINWEVSGDRWCILARSYIRIRFTLKDEAEPANALSAADGIIPNMFLASNLFQSMEFRINDKTVSRMSGQCAQVEALDNRLHKSRSWLESIGKESSLAGLGSRSAQFIPAIPDQSSLVGQVLGPTDWVTGYTAGTTLAFATATGLMTLAGAGALNNNLAIGDVLNAGGVNYVVTSIIDGTHFEAVPATAGNAGGNNAFIAGSVLYKGPIVHSLGGSAYELCWQPSLGIFKVDHALPSGKYTLVLNPFSNGPMQKRCIESVTTDRPAKTAAIAVAAGGFEFLIKDMYLYCAQVEGPRIEDMTYLLDFNEIECVPEQFTGAANTLYQKNFDVSPSTFALTLAFQHTSSGTDTRYSATKFKISSALERQLSRMYINYAGLNKPQPDAEPQWVSGVTNYMIQRYMESQINSGGYFDSGGTESFQEWLERGPYYHFQWPRDGSDRSTRVNAYFQFDTAVQAAGAGIGQVLLFYHFKKVARIRIEDGRVIDVQVESA